ncbi:MAG: hypothetical protein GC151_01090 [Betaproteobacteria bacterium]|nr:hypothetical protein [Betaproteobacteria bacterium]
MTRTSKRIVAVVMGAALALPVAAQDFLQQWMDAATQQRDDFRAQYRGRIEAAGWKFVHGAATQEGVPTSDYFVRGIAARSGGVRSAEVLNAYYSPLPGGDVPEHQSTKSLIWVDCDKGTFDIRSKERFESVDATGAPNSKTDAKPDSAPGEFKAPAHAAAEGELVKAVCAAKL